MPRRRQLTWLLTALLLLCAPLLAQVTPLDAHAAADAAYAEAQQLFQQKTPESLHQAISKGEEALRLYRLAGDRDKEAELLAGIGFTYLTLGDRTQAESYLAQALPILQALHKPGEQGILLSILGSTYEAAKDPGKAFDYYQRALPFFRSAADKKGEATALTGMGRTAFARNDKRQALDFFSQALPLWRSLGDRAIPRAVLTIT